jgi:hypothetical protein
LADVAILLETWVDPPLQPYMTQSIVNWHAALVDPVLKTPVSLPSGGSIVFQYTVPPVITTPAPVSSTLVSTGLYVAELNINVGVYGKWVCTVQILGASSELINQNTMMFMIYPSGQ